MAAHGAALCPTLALAMLAKLGDKVLCRFADRLVLATDLDAVTPGP